MKNKTKAPSEFRLDLVSNDWVIIATGRARRPETFVREKRIREEVAKKDCPFCQPVIEEKAAEKIERDDGSWFILSMPNDFPALSRRNLLNKREKGPYRIMDGHGYHEVIITSDHDKPTAEFSKEEMKMMIDLYQKRYLDLIGKKFIKYVSIFHNHGKEAGASVVHPHSQLIAVPVIDPDLKDSLDGAERYYREHGQCVYCQMLEWDLKDGGRIIYQNEKFAVLCPFAPQVSFEVRIYPKKHQPAFEKISEEEKEFFADALQKALSRVNRALDDPPYNFYFHTAPANGEKHGHYHWHLNIMPKTSVMAGFELGAGIEISTIEPEKAAEFLRKTND